MFQKKKNVYENFKLDKINRKNYSEKTEKVQLLKNFSNKNTLVESSKYFSNTSNQG